MAGLDPTHPELSKLPWLLRQGLGQVQERLRRGAVLGCLKIDAFLRMEDHCLGYKFGRHRSLRCAVRCPIDGQNEYLNEEAE